MTRWLTHRFGLILLAVLIAATAHASDCYDIKNPDQYQPTDLYRNNPYGLSGFEEGGGPVVAHSGSP